MSERCALLGIIADFTYERYGLHVEPLDVLPEDRHEQLALLFPEEGESDGSPQ